MRGTGRDPQYCRNERLSYNKGTDVSFSFHPVASLRFQDIFSDYDTGFVPLLCQSIQSVQLLTSVFILPLMYATVGEQPDVLSHPSRMQRFSSINNSPAIARPNAYMNKSLSYSRPGTGPVREHT